MKETRGKAYIILLLSLALLFLSNTLFCVAGTTQAVAEREEASIQAQVTNDCEDAAENTALGPESSIADFPGGPIIADHTVVDQYDDIPQYWIDEVKKMWIDIPGESHSAAYRQGLVLLAAQNPNYPAVSTESGNPEPYTDQHLRVSGHVRSQYNNWSYGAGEKLWYTWYAYPIAAQPVEKDLIKNHIQYSETNSLHIAAIGFGWCWDTTWTNGPGGTEDPVYQVRWAGSSDGGPDGNLRWGLDDGDYALTGNRVCMDTYLGATEDYRNYCTANGYATQVLFTTGPVDGYTGESGYQRDLKHERIRDFVSANPDRILFDYADILCYDDNGSQTTTSWNGHIYQVITPTNAGDGSVGHIGSAGAVRLAKAMWWMLARIAGWDGTPQSSPPQAPLNLSATTVSGSQIDLAWTDNSSNEDGFRIERAPDSGGAPGTFAEIGTVGAGVTTYSDTGLTPGAIYHYRVRAYNSFGNSGYSNTVKAQVTDIVFSGLSPGDNSSLTSPITFSGTASSPNGIHRVSLWSDWSGTWQEEDGVSYYAAPEMLTNGDFESFNGGLATGWTDQGGGATYTLSSDTGHTGLAQKLAVTAYGGWGVFYCQQPAFELGRTYEWSFWYKTSGTNADLWINVCNPEQSQVILSQQLANTDGLWQQASFTFTWNNAQANLVRFFPHAAGEYWFDESSLKEVGGGTISNQADVSFTKTLPAGTHAWALEAEDGGGTAFGPTYTLNASIDGVAPVISQVQATCATNHTVNITWTTDEPATSRVEYGTSGGYGSLSPEDSALVNAHTVVLTGLESGTVYHYRVISRDAAGNERTSVDFVLTTTAIEAGSSEYYSQWENGLPSSPDFFPLAVWLQSPANAQNYKNIGINTYIGLWEGPTEGQLSSLSSQGMQVIAAQNPVGLSSPNAGIIKSWMHQDEPDNAQPDGSGGYTYCVAPSVLVDLYRGWKANDATRPILLNFGQGVANMGSNGMGWYGRWYLDNIGGRDYSVPSGNYSLYYTEASEGADILSYDIYPVTSSDSWVTGRLEYVAQGVKNLVDWSDGKKPVWNCIETTHIGSQNLPTASQVKSEVWMSIISGSTGIIYFVHEWVPSFAEAGIFRYPEIVSGVTAINAQIQSLAPVLNSQTISGGAQVTSAVPVEAMVKYYGGDVYLFAAAMENNATTASFEVTGVSNGTVEVLGEGRQIALSGGGFQDNFAGYGVHLYRVSPSGVNSPLSPTSLHAASISSSRIDLTWTDNSGNEDGFRIERAPDSGGTPGTFVEIATVGANVTSYTNTGLAANTTYHYRVRAYNAAGDSGYSNTAQATTLAGVSAYTVNTSVSGGGGQVSPASQTVNAGGTATIDIIPDAGYHTASITDNSVGQAIADPYLISNVQGNHNVVVTFAEDEPTASEGTAFYFAEGYTGQGFEEWLCLANPNAEDTVAHITYMFSDGSVKEQEVPIGPTTRKTVDVNSYVGPGRDVSVKITSDAPIVAERPMYFSYKGKWDGGHDVVGATSAKDTFYFAEGYTGTGFEEWLCLMNPNASETIAHITYMFSDGSVKEQEVPIGPTTRKTVDVNSYVGPGRDVSVKITSDAPIVAERPMYFNYKGKWDGGHDVVGAVSPKDTFYFAEGYTGSGFEEWLCLANPNTENTVAHITYMFSDGSVKEQEVPIGPTTRKTVDVNSYVGSGRDVSVKITSDAPIVAERPMYFNYKDKWDGGHDVVGAVSPKDTFYFAEGYTGSGFEEWLCLQNPGAEATTAHITYMFSDGSVKEQEVPIGPTTRKTVDVNSVVGPGKDVSVKITSGSLIVAERPMYFSYKGVWTGGHDVVGYSP